MNTKLKHMLDICEYLVHEFNENRSQIQTPWGPISFAMFQAPWSQSIWGNKDTDRVKH